MKKTYLRIQTFILVLLIILTSFVISPQQAQADPIITDYEDSIQESADQESIPSANGSEDQSESEQADSESEIDVSIPESANPAEVENNTIETDLNYHETSSEQAIDQVPQTEPTSVVDKVIETNDSDTSAADLSSTDSTSGRDNQVTKSDDEKSDDTNNETEPSIKSTEAEPVTEENAVTEENTKDQAVPSIRSTEAEQATEVNTDTEVNTQDKTEPSIESTGTEQNEESDTQNSTNDQNLNVTENDPAEASKNARVAAPESDFVFNATTGTITKYLANEKEVIIPAKIGGVTVTCIGDSAFYWKDITRVTIPSTVKTIGSNAFSQSKLKSVVIPDSVTSIGNSAFAFNDLTSVTLPKNLKTIGTDTFCFNEIESIELPNSITNIGPYAFNVNRITSLTIPNNVKIIGEEAFSSNQITGLTIPNNVTSIGKRAFCNNQLATLTIGSGITTIEKQTFKYNKLVNLSLGSGVQTIGEEAFQENLLNSVTIPDNIKFIDFSAFEDNQLTNVSLGKGVEEIAMYAFSFNKLKSISIPGNVKTLSGFANNELTKVTIAHGVTKINSSAFCNNKLTNLVIPGSVTSIGNWAFHNNQLTSVTIPNSVTEVRADSFSDNQLTRVIIPNSVTRIGIKAFKNNPICYVSIPDSISKISDHFNVDSFPNPNIDIIGLYCFDTSGYIAAGSNIRRTPTGAIVDKLRMPIHVIGTIEGDFLKFTYKGKIAYVHLSVTSIDPPPITGYVKSTVNVRNAPRGNVSGTLPIGRKVSGHLVGNWVMFNYSGHTGYFHASMLQPDPVKVTRYIYANSIIRSAPNGSMITKLWRPLLINGTLEGAWTKFTYNGKTAYVASSLTTTNNPPITGYAKSAINVRNAPGGSVIGTIPIGRQVKGVLVGNMVRFTYNNRTGYVSASLLQATPVKVTRYIIANSIIRSAPNGSIIIRTWRPLLVSGTIEGAWLKFTYNSRTAYVAMSLTTTGNPAMTGYAKQKLYVRNTPNGSVVGTIPRGSKVSGVLVGNMVRFTYNGKTSYVYASLLQKDPV